jgi:hypothetical protein
MHAVAARVLRRKVFLAPSADVEPPPACALNSGIGARFVSAGGWKEQSAWGHAYLDVSRQVESLARQVGQLLAIGEPTWWMRDIRWGSVEVWGRRPTPFLVIQGFVRRLGIVPGGLREFADTRQGS